MVSESHSYVYWSSQDGSELRPSKKVTIISQGTKRNLTIHKCEFDDKGTYVCDAGDDKTSANLTVKGRSDVAICDMECANNTIRHDITNHPP